MKAKWLVIVVILLLVPSLFLACGPASAPAANVAKPPAGYERITIEGTGVGSAVSIADQALVKLLNKYYPEIEWASRTGESSVTPIRLTDGTVKIGIMSILAYDNAFGLGKEAQSRLRSISSPIGEINNLFFVPADKPWNDITQVPKGSTLWSGSVGGSSSKTCYTWLELCGLSKTDFKCVEMAKEAFVEQWRDGKVDLGFGTDGSSNEPYIMDLFASPRKPKPMGLSEAQFNKALAEHTFEKIGANTPAKSTLVELNPDIFTSDVYCAITVTYLAVRDDFPDEIAYKMAKIFDENIQSEIATYAGLKFNTAAREIKYASTPLAMHPGVAKYYKEKGYLK